jgi:hypothetical protein
MEIPLQNRIRAPNNRSKITIPLFPDIKTKIKRSKNFFQILQVVRLMKLKSSLLKMSKIQIRLFTITINLQTFLTKFTEL